MVILTVRMSPLNNMAQAMWLYGKLQEYDPTEPLRFGRDDDDAYWIRVRTPDTRILMAFLKNLAEVTEATSVIEENPDFPGAANAILVALSPFTASEVEPPPTT